MRQRFLAGIATLIALCATQTAFAGGYDTPMLYSARHLGMGGVAIAFVDDPSAIFHNPAGLARANRLSVLGDFSPLLGRITGSPALDEDREPINLESELTFASFFLIGASFQPIEWLAVGIAAYPVASAGGSYLYEDASGSQVVDATKLFFLEIAPGVAFSLPARITLGASYRITMVSLARSRGPENGEQELELDMSGWSFGGFRVGAQWEAIRDHLSIGLTYRHKTVTDISSDQVRVRTGDAGLLYNGTSTFTLPAQLGLGARMDTSGFGLAVDVIIAFNSQNDATTIAGDFYEDDPEAGGLALANIFEWSNAVTMRVGLEYNIRLTSREDRYILSPRLGYTLDSKTTNEEYVTAFGTPPAPTHLITAGLGFDGGPWEVNLAYAYRFGSTEVVTGPDGRERSCPFCGFPGEYDIAMHGIYVDLSLDLGWRGHNPWDARREAGETEAEPEPEATEIYETTPEPEAEPEPEAMPEPEPEPEAMPEPL